MGSPQRRGQMAKIKSALELALEKTADVKTDPEALHRKERQDKAKAMAGKLLDKRELDIAEELKPYEKKEQKEIRDTLLETLLKSLVLPSYPEDVNKLKTLQEALVQLMPKKEKAITEICQQIKGVFEQLMEDKNRLREALAQRYEPTLRQKEQQLAQKTGRQVRLTPEQDPEFMKYLNQNYQQIDDQYRGVLNQAAEEFRRLL